MRILSVLLLLITCCAGTTALFAQTEIMHLSHTTPAGLSTAQNNNYQLLAARGTYKNLYLVETGRLPGITEDNNIVLNLPFLPCGAVSYISTSADSAGTDSDDSTTVYDTYVWQGKTMRDPANYTACTYGEITLLNHNGVFAGAFTVDNHSYELYDLGEGLQVVAEIDYTSEALRNSRCGNAGGPQGVVQPFPVPAECDQVKTKVLVLYTDAAAAAMPGANITSIAQLGIAQLNQTLANSGLNHTVSLRTVKPLPGFLESNVSNIEDDVDRLATNIYVQSLRDHSKAEIVILLTEHAYGFVYGVVRDIGGPKENAYAIVDITEATGPNLTFAHEIGHLFGARHNTDPDPGTAHGYIFHAGNNQMFTLMSETNDYFTSRLLHFSNPNVNVQGQPSGAPFNNNAGKVEDMVNHVAGFYPDPAWVLRADVTYPAAVRCRSQGSATVTAKCGIGGYTYKWYAANYITGAWELVSTAASIATFVPSNPSGFNSRAYKVTVRDGAGRSVTKTIWPVYHCFIEGTMMPARGNGVPTTISNAMALYPNPARNSLNIELDMAAAGKVTIALLDISGKKVQTLQEGEVMQGRNTFTMGLDNIAKGMYFIRLSSAGYNKTEKLIIQ